MCPAFGWSIAPGHHGYQRACDLIAERPCWAKSATSFRKRRDRSVFVYDERVMNIVVALSRNFFRLGCVAVKFVD
jgi:hypothetical protein